MRDARTTKRLGHVLQLVRGEPGQRDSREREGVNPQVAYVVAARYALDERAVKRGVMREDGSPRDKVRKLGHGLAWRRRIRNVKVGDVRQRLDVLGYGHSRIDERPKRVDDLATAQASGGNLRQLALGERQARRLGVENHDVILDQAELLRLCSLGKRAVRRLHLRRRVGQENLPQIVPLSFDGLTHCHELLLLAIQAALVVFPVGATGAALQSKLDELATQLRKSHSRAACRVGQQGLRRHARDDVRLDDVGDAIRVNHEVAA